jgi:hypothetical protein
MCADTGLEGGTTTQGRDGAAERARALPLEVGVVWALFAVVAVEIVVTYSRLPARQLYHVSGTGVSGGASRLLTFLNFPLALVAIPILVVLADRVPSRAARVAAVVGLALSAAIFWPGIVKQSDLDARSVNVIPALGVLIALSLTAVAARRLGWTQAPVRRPGDRLAVVVAAALLVVAVPWLAADVGFYLGGVPVLGTAYQTGERRSEPGMPTPHPAVHHGHHHGMDGVLLVLTALLLFRLVASVRTAWLRRTLAYLALMFCYGIGEIANDFWLEQVVKRGWTNWEIPDVTTPKASVAWGVIVLATVALWTIWLWRAERGPNRAILA